MALGLWACYGHEQVVAAPAEPRRHCDSASPVPDRTRKSLTTAAAALTSSFRPFAFENRDSSDLTLDSGALDRVRSEEVSRSDTPAVESDRFDTGVSHGRSRDGDVGRGRGREPGHRV